MALAVGLIIATIVATLFNFLIPFAVLSKYQIQCLQNYVDTQFEGKSFKDIAADVELLIASYEFNEDDPRFYSKYFINVDPDQYNITLSTAVSSCQAFPGEFDPLVGKQKFGLPNYLIDGSMISNNPSFYAHSIANNLLE